MHKSFSLFVLLMLLTQHCLAYSPIDSSIQQNIARQTSQAVTANINYQMLKPTLKVTNSAGSIRHIALTHDGLLLAFVAEDNVVRLWDLSIGSQRIKINSSHQITAIAVSGRMNNEPVLAVGLDNGEIAIYNAYSGQLKKTLIKHHSAISSLSISVDGSLLSSSAKDGACFVWDIAHRLDAFLSIQNPGTEITALAISQDNKRMLSGDQAGRIMISDIPSGRKISLNQVAAPILHLGFDETSQGATFVTRRGASVLGATSGSPDFSQQNQNTVISAFLANDRGIVALGTDDGLVKLVDIASQRIVKQIKTPDNAVHQVVYAADSNRVITVAPDGKMRLWDASSGLELLQIIITHSGWALIDTHGRFDASEQAMGDVKWSTAKEDIDLARMSKAFYEPGLLSAYLHNRGTGLKPVTEKFSDGMALPPKMEIDFPGGPYDAATQFPPIVVVATDQGGGIGEVRLYHNGKLVDPGSMLKAEEVEGDGRRLRASGFVVQPVPGLNTFAAVGSGLWDIESVSPKIIKTFSGAEPPSTLHLVTIGINQYSDSKLNLNYSVADASAIVSQIDKSAAGIFQAVKIYKLFDADAKKDAILSTLNNLAETAKPSDVIVFYLAGHGLVIGDDWQFMPYETTAGENVEHFAKYGISASTFQDILVKAKAKRVLFLIDACQSGATTQTFKEQQRFQRRFLRELGRQAGITILAAARKDQDAAEMKELGHGLFTYTVLSAITGKADLEPVDGAVTAHETANYVANLLPDLSFRQLKYRQEPMSFLLGADFKITNTPLSPKAP